MNIMWSNLCNNVKICTPLQSTKSKFVESTSSQFHATTLLPYALKYKFTTEGKCLCVGWSLPSILSSLYSSILIFFLRIKRVTKSRWIHIDSK